VTPRARRLLASALAVALVLVVGRWVVDVLATRWWAAAISAGTLQAVTRWQFLGAILDLGAVAVASTWFAVQALLVARAIATVQIQREVGGRPVRESLATRWVVVGAIASGIVLGLLTGAGAHDWRAAVALAWEGVRFGLEEPLLGADLGVFVAQLPLWELAHQFVLLLLGLGLGFSTVLYLAIGAIGVRDRRLRLHPDARRHLGGLLVLLALVIAWGYLLAPYRIATGHVPLAASALRTRVLAAQAMTGAAVAVALLTAIWALRGRQSLVVAAWGVLALGGFAERVIVPAFVAQGPPAERGAELARRFDAALYGVELAAAAPDPAGAAGPPTGGVWDEESLGRWALGQGTILVSARLVRTGRAGLAWQATTTRLAPTPRIVVHLLAPDSIAMDGAPVEIAPPVVIADPRIRPGTATWRATEAGVPTGGALRRLALAWALQGPGIATRRPERIDWHLDPVNRVLQLIPGLGWSLEGVVQLPAGPAWLLSGLHRVDRAPLGTPTEVGGRWQDGLRPAMVATVGVQDGLVRAWLVPGADSLAAAWARIHAPLVGAATDMPTEVATGLRYPKGWFQAQVQALAARDPSLGRLPPPAALAVAGVWQGEPAWFATLVRPDDARPSAIVIGRIVAGSPELRVQRVPDGDAPNGEELLRAWYRMPMLSQLRDSVRAAGDTLLPGPLHWALREDGLLAWQGFASAGRRGAPALLWLGTMRGGTLGGGRTAGTAWDSMSRPVGSADGGEMAEIARLEAVRAWMRRADSALLRRDMTAFGRAWEALRGLLLEGTPE